MFCKYCGKEIKDGSQFCTFCGGKFSGKSQKEAMPSPQKKEKSGKKRKGKVITAIICITVFAGVGAATFLWLNGKEEQTRTIQTIAAGKALEEQKGSFLSETGTDIQESAKKEEEEKKSAEEQQALAEKINTARRRNYYAGVLAGMVLFGKGPDGGKMSDWLMPPALGGDINDIIDENHFAIVDVDNDGKEELIISITTTDMARMSELVIEYDPERGEEYWEHGGYPSITYYGNGMLKQEASHNQGPGESLWPYTLYQYNSSNDTYQEVGSVYTWEKAYAETFLGNPFPEEQDIDGDGVIFYVQDENKNYNREQPLTKQEYEDWIQSYLGDAKEININYQSLALENFKNYTPEYMKLLGKQTLSGSTDGVTDLGILCMTETMDLNGLQAKISGKYPALFQNGKVVYKGNKTEGVTLFGLYPGMKEQDAQTWLETYGFYKDNGNLYITGEGPGNYALLLTVENGVITGIEFMDYCKYEETSAKPEEVSEESQETSQSAVISGERLPNSEIEAEVLRIREIYNQIVETRENQGYTESSPKDGVTAYSENGEVRAVIVLKGVDNVQYTRYYYYENQKLIFAYLEAADSHRLYFWNERLFRWRYAEDANDFSETDNHDNEDSQEFLSWESLALNEAYQYN